MNEVNKAEVFLRPFIDIFFILLLKQMGTVMVTDREKNCSLRLYPQRLLVDEKKLFDYLKYLKMGNCFFYYILCRIYEALWKKLTTDQHINLSILQNRLSNKKIYFILNILFIVDKKYFTIAGYGIFQLQDKNCICNKSKNSYI